MSVSDHDFGIYNDITVGPKPFWQYLRYRPNTAAQNSFKYILELLGARILIYALHIRKNHDFRNFDFQIFQIFPDFRGEKLKKSNFIICSPAEYIFSNVRLLGVMETVCTLCSNNILYKFY